MICFFLELTAFGFSCLQFVVPKQNCNQNPYSIWIKEPEYFFQIRMQLLDIYLFIFFIFSWKQIFQRCSNFTSVWILSKSNFP